MFDYCFELVFCCVWLWVGDSRLCYWGLFGFKFVDVLGGCV